jgi:hypothetical protein
MRLAGSASWQVRCDIPEELQFSGYVGEHAGFSLAPDQVPRDPTEAAWRAWWDALLTQTFGVHAEQMAQELSANSPAEHQALLREAGERARRGFGPPEFPELAHTPDLQQLCRREWPLFQPGWGIVGGQKWLLSTRMQEQLQRVRLDRLVRACTADAGQSETAPFALRVDFVRWPQDYQHHVSQRHLVLGAYYLDAAHADALQAVLQAAIISLV